MLFDLQSPRRKRAVRIIFGGLAGVFAISFVALGVGTGGSGFSLSDLFGGGGGGSQSSAFDDQIKAAEKQLQVNPNDTTALANLVQYQYQAASGTVDSSGRISSDGIDHLREAADAWNKYVKVSPNDIGQTAALFAFQAFDLLGTVDFQKARTDSSTADALRDVNAAVDDWRSAAQAQQALIAAQPNKGVGAAYTKLAFYLYLSGQTQAANQAAAKAKQAGSKGSSAQLTQVEQLGTQLQTAIKQLTKQQQQTSQGATGGGNPLGGISGTGGGSVGGAGTGGPLSTP